MSRGSKAVRNVVIPCRPFATCVEHIYTDIYCSIQVVTSFICIEMYINFILASEQEGFNPFQMCICQ